MDTVERVFYAIAKDNLHTRREIADALGLSFVTVTKTVYTLISAGLISQIGKNESDVGRKSDFLDVSPSASVLLINLCGENLSYFYSYLCDSSSGIVSLPYLDSLDFADNLLILINHIKKHVSATPLSVAVAVPGEIVGGRISNAYITDYPGFDIISMFNGKGITIDIMMSAANAVEASCLYGVDDAFISVSKATWGTFGRGRIERWGNITVDSRNLLSFDKAICSSSNENIIADYSLRLINTIDHVISPERILFSCDRISDERIDIMRTTSAKLVKVDTNEMILDGLMELAVKDILKKI